MIIYYSNKFNKIKKENIQTLLNNNINIEDCESVVSTDLIATIEDFLYFSFWTCI